MAVGPLLHTRGIGCIGILSFLFFILSVICKPYCLWIYMYQRGVTHGRQQPKLMDQLCIFSRNHFSHERTVDCAIPHETALGMRFFINHQLKNLPIPADETTTQTPDEPSPAPTRESQPQQGPSTAHGNNDNASPVKRPPPLQTQVYFCCDCGEPGLAHLNCRSGGWVQYG